MMMEGMSRTASTSSRNDLFNGGSTTGTTWPSPRTSFELDPTPPSKSPRTSLFFDNSATATPPPAPRIPLAVPSPLNLSRSSSVARKPPGAAAGPPPPEALSPLHQSPSLLPATPWTPPVPQSDVVEWRMRPSDEYLLGEGRYARVYLASYRKSKGKGKDKDTDPAEILDAVNESRDGLVGGTWRLCAAKRLNPDRESQTMGLREAVFLNRLKPCEHEGSVYIVRLLAVKEDTDKRLLHAHARAASDIKYSRQRSSTDLPALLPSEPAPAASRSTLLLEHAPLGTLDRLLRTSPGVVGQELWAKWAKQTAAAVAWIHSRGVIHADIKPGNLLLTADLDLRLSDFGSSLLVHSSHPPIDGVGLGTLPFSAPELVDPSRSFSFPVDIFALGATLYQCITGKEPYHGLRAVEIMHHVRKGDLWDFEERHRLDQLDPRDMAEPYPSAWREATLKRGGSLRVPAKPRLQRMSSADSLRVSNDVVDGNVSPAGVKLWARWVHRPQPGADAISALLAEDGILRSPRIQPKRPSLVAEAEVVPPLDDGSMLYLNGERVPEGVRGVLREMLVFDPELRPAAEQLSRRWSAV